MSPASFHPTAPTNDHCECLATDTTASGPGSSPLFTAMVNRAAGTIYQAWRRHLTEGEARAEAERFARRFHVLVDGPLAPQPAHDRELDAMLDGVREAMT